MIPIPRSLLCQSAEVRIPVDGFYRGEYAEPVTVGHVRFEPSRTAGGTAYQDQNPVRGTLFLGPDAPDLPAGALVKVEGMEAEAEVAECCPIYGMGGRIHHWEAVLK